MVKIKASIVLLLAWFGLLLNYEYLLPGRGGYPLFDAQLFTLIFVQSALMLFFADEQPQILPMGGLFMMIHLTACAVLQEVAVYPIERCIIGAVMLAVNPLIVDRVCRAIYQLDQAAQTMLIGDQATQLLAQKDGEEQVNQELHRARRYQRPVAIVYCQLPLPTDETQPVRVQDVTWHISRAMQLRYQRAQLVRWISTLTYKSDILVEYREGVIVCLPETSQAEADVFIQHLASLVSWNLDCAPIAGVACFPEAGLVYEALVKEAYYHAYRPGEHSEPAEPVMRKGAEMVDVEVRNRIEQQTEWVSRLPSLGRQARRLYHYSKRPLDCLVVLLVLPVAVPLLLLIALIIYLDDQHTPLYIQWRTGYRGQRFRMVKFRTMQVDAEPLTAQMVAAHDGSIRLSWRPKSAQDARITRVGRLLRATSLDELPQLWNVLRGEMSLVGPRPTSWDLDMYTSQQTERLTVRPGITGLWQVSARESTNLDEWLLWDIKYIENLSPWLDVMILWRTVFQVLRRKGR